MQISKIFKKTRKYYSTVPVASSHCSYCGTQYTSEKWPRLCSCCNNTTFRNPIPVAVGLIPVIDNKSNRGLLLVQRGIKPHIGGLCLPGGFVEEESCEEAIVREVYEETSLQTQPSEFTIVGTYSTPDKTRILIFGISRITRHMNQLNTFKPTNETSAIKLGLASDKLCFSLHQKVFDEWFIKNILE